MKPKWILAAVVTIVIVALSAFFLQRHTLLPDELVGVWTTSDSRYADRMLDLSKVTIIFGTGKDNIDTYFISNVKKKLHEDATLYTVYFHNLEGLKDRASFYYEPQNGGTIRFKNQKQAWSKQKSDLHSSPQQQEE
ncbi:MAG: hypothetical protein ABIF87_16360 [Pseudomonadota bacterium]